MVTGAGRGGVSRENVVNGRTSGLQVGMTSKLVALLRSCYAERARHQSVTARDACNICRPTCMYTKLANK